MKLPGTYHVLLPPPLNCIMAPEQVDATLHSFCLSPVVQQPALGVGPSSSWMGVEPGEHS